MRSPSPKQPGEEINEDDVIKVTTNLVTSNALVVGRDRKLVPALRREDFRIFENGVEQPIASFASVDRPFDVALLIDNSRSTAFELRYIKQAAIAFVDEMRPNDRAAIVAVSDSLSVPMAPTSDHQVLIQSIEQIKLAGGTRLYDSVDFAIKRILANGGGRRALILLTDGVDNDSRHATYESNLGDILSSGVQMYAIQFSTSEAAFKQSSRIRRAPPEGSGFSRIDYQRADAYLHQVATLTGTTLFPAASLSDLDAAVAAISDELHNEYTIGFYPRSIGKPGEVRTLEVRVNQPWLRVRARTSYSLGGGVAVAAARDNPPLAPLTGIESRSPFRAIPETAPPRDARWICKGPSVPAGFALVREGFDSKCPATKKNEQTNAWFIRKPGPTEVICKGFLWTNGSQISIVPIPQNYAVVGEEHSAVCSPSQDPKRTANAWRIKQPSAEETVCKGFQIPRDFVVVNQRKSAACPATSQPPNAWVIVPRWDIERRKFWSEP
jgi:VWFA-related protein